MLEVNSSSCVFLQYLPVPAVAEYIKAFEKSIDLEAIYSALSKELNSVFVWI